MFVILFHSVTLQGQKNDTAKILPGTNSYNAWIDILDAPDPLQGQIYLVSDSSLTFVQNYGSRNSEIKRTLKPENIDVIKTRGKGSVGVGIGIGLASGVVASIIAAVAMKPSEPKPTYDPLTGLIVEAGQAVGNGLTVFAIGFSTAILGTTIGAILGSAKKVFPVKASRMEFDQQKKEINKYALYNNTDLHVGKMVSLKQYVWDIDSNSYPTLALGGQVWMAGDLKVTRFRDGSMIRNTENQPLTEGQKYSWTEINHASGICPQGWHVPSMAEWNSLILSLGGNTRTPAKLAGIFTNKNFQVGWWSSTADSTGHVGAFFMDMESNMAKVIQISNEELLPVRCIRDTIR